MTPTYFKLNRRELNRRINKTHQQVTVASNFRFSSTKLVRKKPSDTLLVEGSE